MQSCWGSVRSYRRVAVYVYRWAVEPFGHPPWEEKTDGMGGTGHSANTIWPVYRRRGEDRDFRKLSIRDPHTSSVASRRARSRGREIHDILTTESAEELK